MCNGESPAWKAYFNCKFVKMFMNLNCNIESQLSYMLGPGQKWRRAVRFGSVARRSWVGRLKYQRS